MPAAHKHGKRLNLRLTLSATLLGNTLEWYDYITYGFLVPIFSVIFFQEGHPREAVLQTLLIYALGSVARPLGGILFGFIGDRYGRKRALIASISFMAIPVLIIGMLPTYAQIGFMAPLLLSIMRLFQGIAAGGEFSGITVFLVESSPKKQRGFFGSFVYLGVVFGLLTGAFDYLALDLTLPISAIYAWGWRIPFLIGGILGGCAFYLRRKLHETPLYHKCQSLSEVKRFPLGLLFKRYKKSLLLLSGLVVLETVAFNLLIIFLLTYLTNALHTSFKTALTLNLFLLCSIAVGLPIAGKLSSRYGCRKIAFSAALGFVLFSYPLLMLVSVPAPLIQGIGLSGFGFLLAGYTAPLPSLFSDLFPTSVRFSGIGLGYNVTIALIGGTSPLLSLYLIRYFDMLMAPAFLITAAGCISLLTLQILKRQKLYLE